MAPAPATWWRWSARDDLPSATVQTIPAARLLPGWQAGVAGSGLAIAFDRPWHCLSSAVAGGGWSMAQGFANRHVGDDDRAALNTPAALIADFAAQRGLAAPCVGMLTAASMRSLRFATVDIEGERLCVVVTAGLANARRAGDRADRLALRPGPCEAGTINLALATTLALTPAAQVETLATLTEAKAAALQALDARSPISNDIATGTGTDATAVFCTSAGEPLRYTGKHTLFGEYAARLVIDALTDAICPQPGWADGC
ncbi:hypothetical protein T5B8_12523 [Salinisphaera sp. T5B8]|uniref:adenosylcobinamide amidohydrolase n=1 Tax=Salinisphaera sp. T5B8 TaxID=1304154 RepID=UPI0033405896